MTPALYNHHRIVTGKVDAFTLYYLSMRYMGEGLTASVSKAQRAANIRVDGKIGPVTCEMMPTGLLLPNRNSFIAAALYATAGRPYRFGSEMRIKNGTGTAMTWSRFKYELNVSDHVKTEDGTYGIDCSELIEICAAAVGALVDGRPLVDGSWRQYEQLAAAGMGIQHHLDTKPGDLVFKFISASGKIADDLSKRPAIAHVGIVLNDMRWTIEAAQDGCGPHPPSNGWTHFARLFP